MRQLISSTDSACVCKKFCKIFHEVNVVDERTNIGLLSYSDSTKCFQVCSRLGDSQKSITEIIARQLCEFVAYEVSLHWWCWSLIVRVSIRAINQPAKCFVYHNNEFCDFPSLARNCTWSQNPRRELTHSKRSMKAAARSYRVRYSGCMCML